MFSKDFLWGAASAAYQVEGAAYEDGKGLSIWDTFCKRPGAIADGQSGDITSDHYHHLEEDVALMKEIGLKSYRFSIGWPRVLPEGTGSINPKGIDFYNRLVDALLAAGIQPCPTLFHWDYPVSLFNRGGWLNRDSADWFAEYAATVATALGDRVKYWMTINEPQSFIGLGHLRSFASNAGGSRVPAVGVHPPGINYSTHDFLKISHHVLLAHGKAVQTIRSNSPGESVVGYAPVGVVYHPVTDAPEDIEAARKMTFAVTKKNHENSSWWMDPLFFGKYPEDGLELFGGDMPNIPDGDMQTIAQPLDYLGVNIYMGFPVKAGPDGSAELIPNEVGQPLSTMLWPITPEALYWGPKFFYERYKVPLMITENGTSTTDWVSMDGKVHDAQRIDFLHRYLLQLKKAVTEGVDVRGYQLWTIMDNFEWVEGFTKRFGLIYVDYPTGKRTLKDSAYWYKDVIASNGENL
jgi:beta-glucosidase